MHKIDDDIWVHEDVMSLAGTPLRLRMTVVRLADGSLWVHSPTALSPALQNEINQLGPVSAIAGANNGHNIWLREWHEAFPEATLHVSGGIPKKLKLTEYQLLDDAQQPIWQEDLEREYMPSVPFFCESVFLHKKSKSLIVSDLIQNHSDGRPGGIAGLVSRLIFEPIGFKDICVAPPLKMKFVIKNKPDFAAFIERVQRWDFERIVVAHGDIIDSNAKQLFSDLTARFLD